MYFFIKLIHVKKVFRGITTDCICGSTMKIHRNVWTFDHYVCAITISLRGGP